MLMINVNNTMDDDIILYIIWTQLTVWMVGKLIFSHLLD